MRIKHLNIVRRLWNQQSGIAQRRLALKKEEIKEGNMETHRVMVTVSDPHHTMQTMRKEKIMKRVKVKANDREHAVDSAIHHYKKAGYKVHDHEYIGKVNESLEESSNAYEKAEENKKSADAAKKQGDMFAHHLHMADHHDNMAQWHSEKGRHGEADRHAEKSEKHHEQAMSMKESLDEAHKLGDKVIITKGPKDVVGKTGHVGEIRKRWAGDSKTYTIDHDKGSIQLKSTHFKKHVSEEVELDEATMDELRKKLSNHTAKALEANKRGDDEAVKKHQVAMNKLKDRMTKLVRNEEVAANNVGGGSIAGTQGDAGKKAVMTKEPLKRQKLKNFKEFTELDEAGLWDNIHAKRKRIKNGSGERMRKPGEKGAPTAADFKAASESVEIDEAAVDAKGHKSSTGGLTQKGRDYYNNKTGGNLKAPVTTPPSKLDPDSKAAKRRKSFCARMGGMPGPMKDEKGRPTRKALALRKWNC